KFAIEELIAQRFPESEALPLVEVLPASPSNDQLAAGPVGSTTREPMAGELAPGPVGSQISGVQSESSTEEQPSPTLVAAPAPAVPTPAAPAPTPAAPVPTPSALAPPPAALPPVT